MRPNPLPEDVRHLIFEYIDSVEQLEVLLFMRAHRGASYDSLTISAELRSNPQSVLKRMLTLEASGFVVRAAMTSSQDADEILKFDYEPRTIELDRAIDQLAEIYRIRPQKIFEVIFSPLKKGRQFAAAFLVKTPKKENEDG